MWSRVVIQLSFFHFSNSAGDDKVSYKKLSVSSDAFAELGESLQHLLTGLEDLGVESLPPEMESEMRRAMSLSPHPDTVNLDTDSLPSSAFASQFGTPYGLSPAEEMAFSSMIHQMMVAGAGSDDCDPVLEQFIWSADAQWEGEGEGVAAM